MARLPQKREGREKPAARTAVAAPRRLIVGITGATGAIYGIRLLEALRVLPGWETHLVVSDMVHSIGGHLGDAQSYVGLPDGDICANSRF